MQLVFYLGEDTSKILSELVWFTRGNI